MTQPQKTVPNMKAELDEIKAKFAGVKQTLQRQIAVFNNVVAHSDGELKKYEKEAASPDRDHYLLIYRLRRLMASRSIEMLNILMQFDPANPNSERVYSGSQPKLQALANEIRYISTEYSVLNYRPIARAMQNALQANGSGRLGTGKLGAQPSGPQRPGTGPMRAGTGQLRQGTGPLQQPAPQRPGTGPVRPGTGPLQAPTGSGPLNQAPAAASARRPGTGSLAGGTGQLPNGGTPMQQLQAQLTRAAQDAAQRKLIETAVIQFQEVEAAMQQMRGENFGEAAMPFSQIAEPLNKVAGKIYYMKRTVDQMGPLAPKLAFETEGQDMDLQQFLAKNTAGSPAAESGGLTSKLKSFLGLS